MKLELAIDQLQWLAELFLLPCIVRKDRVEIIGETEILIFMRRNDDKVYYVPSGRDSIFSFKS
jgi:hypothetical protein